MSLLLQMVGHHSPKPKEDDEPIVRDDLPTSVETPVVNPETPVVNKDKPNPGKLRPVRKAPAPPDSSVSPASESKIPKMARPNRKAPPPPVSQPKIAEKEKTEQKHAIDPLYDVIGNKPENNDIVNNDVKTNDSQNNSTMPSGISEEVHDNKNDVKPKSGIPVKTQGDKPVVRRRYIKPRVVSVPRNSVNLSDFHFEREHSRKHITRPKAPPPPRPSQPSTVVQDELAPEKVTLPRNDLPKNNFEPAIADAGDNMDHKLSDSEETESFFNISPQRKFDNQLKRQDSSDVDDSLPYKSLSSFGSTFGKREASPKETVNNQSRMTGIPKLTRQTVVEDDLSPTKNDVHEEFNSKNPKDFKPNLSVQENVTDQNDNSMKDDSISNDYEIIKTPDREGSFRTDLNECSSFLEITDTSLSENQIKLPNESEPIVHNVSKIPKLPGSDNVSKIPMSHGAKQKSDFKNDKKTDDDERDDEIESKTKDIDTNANKDVSSVDKTSVNLKDNKIDMTDKLINGDIKDMERPRTNSMDKPPVAPKPKPSGLPKVLPKPKSVTPEKKGPEIEKDAEHLTKEIPKPESIVKSPSPDTVEGSKKPPEPSKVSKIPHGSKIAQKSPGIKKASKIPASPKIVGKAEESKETTATQNDEVKSENEIHGPKETVSLKHKPESPVGARKIPRHRTFSNENPSLRNRSNSPSGRTGIPSPSVRNRSNSPATPKPVKPSNIPSPSGIPSLSAKPKPTALPKKQIKQDSVEKVEKSEPDSPVSPKPVNETYESHSSDELEDSNARPSRPSKPPRIQKQKSADSKIPKQGKSLLPVIHKSLDGGSTSGSGKAKTGIPMAKPPRPPQPKSTAQPPQENG